MDKNKFIIAKKEFFPIIKDIISNQVFIKTKKIKHHDRSIYHHSRRVAFISYLIGKKLKWKNIYALTRGAILHDFFLYDWRKGYIDPKTGKIKRFHGFWHPKVALENSKKYFSISKLEEDIILKHMWPLTFYLIPKYKESWLVSFIDKYVATLEFLREIKGK